MYHRLFTIIKWGPGGKYKCKEWCYLIGKANSRSKLEWADRGSVCIHYSEYIS